MPKSGGMLAIQQRKKINMAMMVPLWVLIILTLVVCPRMRFGVVVVVGFQPSVVFPQQRRRRRRTKQIPRPPLRVVGSDDDADEPILDKTRRILLQQDDFRPDDTLVQSIFSDSVISNNELLWKVVSALSTKHNFRVDNTLLATSLCSDEVARRLEDDFVKVYGSNFSLGGLAGFPFAGNIGFQTMCGHIPDDGFCLLVYGPHIGITKDGILGMVERKGVSETASCCTSAIKASDQVLLEGDDDETRTTTTMDAFTDLQQGAVLNLLRPLSERLKASDNPLLELPYAIYDSQTQLIQEIVLDNISGIKEGIAIVGGIQINTGPDTLDYFHPLCFSLVNNRGELVEDMLPELSS